jgi:hypothetical protein
LTNVNEIPAETGPMEPDQQCLRGLFQALQLPAGCAAVETEKLK